MVHSHLDDVGRVGELDHRYVMCLVVRKYRRIRVYECMCVRLSLPRARNSSWWDGWHQSQSVLEAISTCPMSCERQCGVACEHGHCVKIDVECLEIYWSCWVVRPGSCYICRCTYVALNQSAWHVQSWWLSFGPEASSIYIYATMTATMNEW
jgi:hypothetical protein